MKLLISILLMTFSLNAFGAPDDQLRNIKFDGISVVPVTSGAPTKLADFKDKIVVIDFWASWCEPCKYALPHYNKLYKSFKNRDVIFVGINEDDDAKERDATLKAIPLDFPIYQDKDQTMAKKFQVVALPTLYVLNKNHEVVRMFRGFDKSKPNDLEILLKELTQKK